jgi:hypothetical protein
MPNGAEGNVFRLAYACALFKKRHGAWPTEARVEPRVLWDYGQVLDEENFGRLCSLLRLRSTKHGMIAVGTPKAHLVYDGMQHNLEQQEIDEAWNWLGLRIIYGDHD